MFTYFMSTKVGRLLAALLTAAALLFGAIQYGRQDQKNVQKVEDLEDYVETKKEIDDVEVSPGRDAAIERLRSNGILGGRAL